MNEDDPVVAADVAEYERLALEWAAASGVPRVANRLMDRHNAIFKRLRETAEGRRGVEALMVHASPDVRRLAASHALSWGCPAAEGVLRDLEKGKGDAAFHAMMVLRQYRAGRLKYDW